jgi:DNA-binding LytR/AlgR family response regulator
MNMKQFKCVIIDDDRYAIEGLAAYINAVPGLELIKSYENPVEALMGINDLQSIDLIFLDIHMPQITGIQLSKEIKPKTKKLIFTTSYTQYGYDAFEVEADGYLLKPFSLQKFTSTISKVMSSIRPSSVSAEGEPYIFVKSKHEHHRIFKIWYKEIIAVESQQNYSKKVVTYMSLSDSMKFLSAYSDFIQFQRSFIIAKSRIESILGNSIKMDNGLEFVVGDKYRISFQNFVKTRLLKTGA